jgi:3-oxoacyl-[acyl-carrier protein] reductase
MSDRGQLVIVTGGSRGLGLALCRDLLAHGYRVATCSRQRTDALAAFATEAGPENFFHSPCVLGDEAQEAAFFDAVIKWKGAQPLYGLVNNAAIAGEGILATFPNADSERILTTNLLSALRLSRLALRVLLAQNRPARLINISSIVGLRGYTGLAAYSASKAGLDGMTRALAREVGRRNITVNSVAPGYLTTELSSSLGSDQRRQIINRTPLGRLGDVADVVPAVRFLLSEGAGFISGQTLVVDGGISC